MNWPVMNIAEIHEFGIQTILPYLEKEGLTIQEVNTDLKVNPQIVGQRWGSLAFVFVRTACYPSKGALTETQFISCLEWANKFHASPFFTSVGIACTNYPDKSPINDDSEMRIPYRNGGFAISYQGLLIMTTTDHVRMI